MVGIVKALLVTLLGLLECRSGLLESRSRLCVENLSLRHQPNVLS